MKKIKAYRVTCPKCKLTAYSIVPEVYGSCPYCKKTVHWQNKEKLFERATKQPVSTGKTSDNTL